MSDEPLEMQGRHFEEGGFWVYLVCGTSRYIAKVMADECKKAMMGEGFEAYHVLTVAPDGGIVYMPAAIGTTEPWHFNKVDTIAMMHPKRAASLEHDTKKAFSVIQEVKNNVIMANEGTPRAFKKL